jgi:hypothetical protein
MCSARYKAEVPAVQQATSKEDLRHTFVARFVDDFIGIALVSYYITVDWRGRPTEAS